MSISDCYFASITEPQSVWILFYLQVVIVVALSETFGRFLVGKLFTSTTEANIGSTRFTVIPFCENVKSGSTSNTIEGKFLIAMWEFSFNHWMVRLTDIICGYFSYFLAKLAVENICSYGTLDAYFQVNFFF